MSANDSDLPSRHRRRGATATRVAPVVALLIATTMLHVACSVLNGSIRVRGRVVDAETGESLDDVEIQLQRSAFSLSGDDFGRTVLERRKVDDRFEIACRDCRNLALAFSKPGYHGRRVQVALDPEDDGARRRDEQELVIELLREGDIVRLDTYQGVLRYGVDERQVLPVELGPIVHGLAPDGVVARAVKAGRPDDLGHVALDVEVDAAGAVVEVEHRGWPRPREAALDFSSAQGGAIPYAPVAKDVRDIALEMREAPTDGYRPTLALDPTQEGTQYFYVKIGERFGRGQVTPVIIERTGDGRRATVSVRLSLSPEPGSRNLETR